MSRQQERYQQIAQVLSRHGMGYFVGLLGLEQWVPFERGLLGHERREEPYSQPEHVRLALEELGASFIKLGQILSTRPDLLPPDFQHELAKLQDDAPPVPEATVRAAVTEEFGRSPEEAFASFDPSPLASASIGTVHAATLADGTEVVVKVRRPGVVEQVADDLEILHHLAARVAKLWDVAADYDVVGLTAEFADTLRAELDYMQEGHNAERFAANFAGSSEVHIPRVFWDTTTSGVLTLERLRGIKVSDLSALNDAGIDRGALATRATRVVADMIFVHGFFHADPHPGNLFIEPTGRIGILDFGMVGEVDERTRQQLARLLAAFARADSEGIALALLEIGDAPRGVDRVRLSSDAAALVSRYEGRPVGQIPIGTFVGEVLAILRRHHVTVPRELALLLKMLVMTEGMGAHLDPEFRLGEVLGPYAQRLVARQFDPSTFARTLGQAGGEAAQLALALPGQLRRLLDVLDHDGLAVNVRPEELEPLVARAERIGNRLVAGMVAAAFIEGLAELVASDPQRWRTHEPRLVAVGVGMAVGLTGYLAWTARGLGRRKT